MAIALREFFFFPIEKTIPERKPSPYPEPRRPSGVRPPATEAEAAAAAVKVIFGPLNWIDEQYAIDRRAKPWKQVKFGGRLGKDPSGEDYALDLRGGWRQFLTHPVKSTKSATKKLLIRKAYDSIQSSLLRRQIDLWKAGKITTQEYNKFVGRLSKSFRWIGPRDWEKGVGTSLTKGSGRLWEWMDFIDDPIGYSMREYVWKKGVRPTIKKVTSPITKPIRKFFKTKIGAPIKAKIIDPIKAKIKSGLQRVKTSVKTRVIDPAKAKIRQAVGKAWTRIKQQAGKIVNKATAQRAAQVVKTGVKSAVQKLAPLVKQGVVAAGRALVTVGTQVVTFVGGAVSSLVTAVASAVSASTIAIIAVVVILLLIVLALITTIGTHSAFLPPDFGPPLPGERFVQMRKLIYHETTAGDGVNPLKIPLGARPDVNFEIVFRNVSGGMLANIRVVDDYDESALINVAVMDVIGVDDSDKIIWDIGDLADGEARSLFYETDVEDVNIDQVIFNNVVLTATMEDGEAVNVTAQGVVIVGNPSGQPPSGWPTGSGCISQGFNVTTDPNASHYGKDVIDIAGVANQAILATHDGTVYFGWTARAGNYVRIVSEISGFETFYCHMISIDPNLVNGRQVVPGQRIGGMGAEGNTDGGVHVHYEVKKDDILVTSRYIPDNSFDGCVDRVTIPGGNCDCCFTSRDARCGE